MKDVKLHTMIQPFDPSTKIKMEETFSPGEIVRILKAKGDLALWVKGFSHHPMEGYFVTGGCIASLILGDEPNDIDIYFSDKEFGDYMKKLYTEDPEYMSKVLDIAEKYSGMSSTQDPNAVVPSEPCVAANAITLKNKIQLITRKYGTPEEIRKE